MKPTIRPRTVAILASGLAATLLLAGAVAAGDAWRGRETGASMMSGGMGMHAEPTMDPAACPCAGDPAAHHAAMHGNSSAPMHATAMRAP